MATKTNAEGWIKNRGRKTLPFADGTLIDVRRRNGREDTAVPCGSVERDTRVAFWGWDNHNKSLKDVLAYRLHVPAAKAAEPAPAAAPSAPVFNPIAARNRVREIVAAVAGLEAEREQLVSALRAEGFALLDVVAQPAEDMSDWRNWKVGDIVKLSDAGCAMSGMPKGAEGRITDFEASDHNGQYVEIDDCYWPQVNNLTWHSRPSA